MENQGRVIMIYAEFKEVTIRLNMLDLEFMKSGIQPNDTVILPADGLPLAVPELPDTPTVQHYAETFLEYRRNTVRNSSYQRSVRCLKSKILPYFGDMRLNAVNGKTVQGFVNTMLRNGMAVKSIKYCVGLLKSIFRCAEMEGIIKMPVIRPDYPKQYKKECTVLTDEQFHQLDDYLVHEMKVISSALLIVMHTGIRLGEVCALQWSDIDFNTNSFYIQHSVQRYYIPDEKRTVCELGEPKTPKSKRRVYLPEHLTEFLRIHQGTGYICTGTEKFGNPESVRNAFNRRLEKLNIPHVRFHDLRHGFATRAINGAGIDPKTVAEILGHEHCDITLDIYTSCTAEMQIDAMNRIEKNQLFWNNQTNSRQKGE